MRAAGAARMVGANRRVLLQDLLTQCKSNAQEVVREMVAISQELGLE